MKIWHYISISIVVALVGLGIYVAGSPMNERIRRFDERRSNDLQSLQYNVIDYWQRKQTLPPNLEATVEASRGMYMPVDPETGENYEYNTTGALSFELCANFKTSSTANPNNSYAPMPVKGEVDFFTHDIGHKCFAKTIDPILYKPYTDAVDKPVR